MAAKTYVNDNGVWREITKVFINDNGTWRETKKVYFNDNGTWREVHAPYSYWTGTIGAITYSYDTWYPYAYRWTGPRNKTSGDATLIDFGLYGSGQPNFTETEWLRFSADLPGTPSTIKATFNNITRTFSRMTGGDYYSNGPYFDWGNWVGQTLPLVVTP